MGLLSLEVGEYRLLGGSPGPAGRARLRWSGRTDRARGLRTEQVDELVEQNIEAPWLPFIGEPVVNVLRLNLALDAFR